MANTDPKLRKAAQEAYAASNVSLNDYDPSSQEALDDAYLATRGGPNTHPSEPILTSAEDTGVVPKPKKK